jgi:preprotein translocase subunit SecF
VTTPVSDDSPRRDNIFRRLYNGETDFRFMSRTKLWFALSGIVIVIGLAALPLRGGLNLGIDFTGGAQWEVPANGQTVEDVESAMDGIGFSEVEVQEVGEDLRIQAPEIEGTELERADRNDEVVNTLAELTEAAPEDVVVSTVGASWGEEISEKALRALVFFLIAIVIYITIRFEFRMAVATLGALVHDILVVVGVYAVLQLPVTPATVIAILTILGFSIYDGIVVFDRVDENTRLLTGSARMTYSEMVDMSLNQVLMRSLNTQVTALLPILSVLLVGSLALGATTLQEFGLALFIGQMSGAYSSIFIASPLLAILKEREPRYRALRQRLGDRSDRAPLSGAAALAAAEAADEEGTVEAADAPKRPVPTRPTTGKVGQTTLRTHPPRPRKQGKKR